MCHASLESTKKVVCMLLNLRMVVTWFALRNLPGLFLMPSLVMDVPPTKRTLSVLLVLIIHSSILGPSTVLVSFEILFKLFLICVDLTRTLWTSRMWMGIRSVIHMATSQVVVRRGSILWMPHNCFFSYGHVRMALKFSQKRVYTTPNGIWDNGNGNALEIIYKKHIYIYIIKAVCLFVSYPAHLDFWSVGSFPKKKPLGTCWPKNWRYVKMRLLMGHPFSII